MPLYEYQCEACNHRFERIQKYSDPPIDVCPVCGGAVRKLISSPAIQFKGTGWYVTDYPKKSSTDGNKSGSSSGSSSSGDAKPASSDTSSTSTSGDTSSTPKTSGSSGSSGSGSGSSS